MTDRLYEWPGDDAPIEMLCLPVSARYGKRVEEPEADDEAPAPVGPRRKRTPELIAVHERQIARLARQGWNAHDIGNEIGLNKTTVSKTISQLGLQAEWHVAIRRQQK